MVNGLGCRASGLRTRLDLCMVARRVLADMTDHGEAVSRDAARMPYYPLRI